MPKPRKKIKVLGYEGPDRRSGTDRRSAKNRRWQGFGSFFDGPLEKRSGTDRRKPGSDRRKK